MFLKKYRDEEYNQVTKTGNNLDLLIIELEDTAERMDYKAVNLEEQYIANIDSLVYEGSEFKNSQEVNDYLNLLYIQSKVLYDVIRKIKAAIAQDGTSELNTTYNSDDSNEDN